MRQKRAVAITFGSGTYGWREAIETISWETYEHTKAEFVADFTRLVGHANACISDLDIVDAAKARPLPCVGFTAVALGYLRYSRRLGTGLVVNYYSGGISL